ncbi:TonB family protein [Oricola thermophila]|uniref:TonB family protein n=1 Tax=Oricola thermophila TaxID=2742145 RepID=A0A6N1VLZ7_9HYPH|nr:TonB family protein [Oricola thermophila]QKV20452.1 TonB family protein [Oricola thermophila]
MRVGLVTSGLLHAVALTWGMLTLSAPESFDVADVESLPVELVSIAELTQIQKGAEEAPKDGPAAPTPTEKPTVDPEAENIGDKERDQAAPETEEQKPVEVDQATLPKPSDAPTPETPPREEPVPDQVEQAEPEPVPTTEVAALPTPPQEVQADPVKDAIEKAEPLPEEIQPESRIPEQVPVPALRPERPTAQTARTDQRRENEPQQRAETPPPAPESDSTEDEVAALLNQEQASGGGAQRSRDPASLGGQSNTGGSELTQSEMDALRSQIQACWNPPAAIGAGDLRVSVRFRLDPSGMVEGAPTITQSSGNRAADESARRAILICGQRGYKLPAEKYDAWRDVVVNFDPSEMFR